jgi:secreted trypsin-like serine protease
VVKIRAVYTKPTGYFNICTATVLEPRLILTAAHCISRPYPGREGAESFVPNLSEDITIYYTDSRGQERTAKSKTTFSDPAFLSNFFKYSRIIPKQLNE